MQRTNRRLGKETRQTSGNHPKITAKITATISSCYVSRWHEVKHLMNNNNFYVFTCTLIHSLFTILFFHEIAF